MRSSGSMRRRRSGERPHYGWRKQVCAETRNSNKVGQPPAIQGHERVEHCPHLMQKTYQRLGGGLGANEEGEDAVGERGVSRRGARRET